MGKLGILILLAAIFGLYYSGAGVKIMANLKELPVECNVQLSKLSPSVAGNVCNAFDRALNALDEFTNKIGTYEGQLIGKIKTSLNFDNSTNMDYYAQANGASGWHGLMSSASALEEKIKQGVQYANRGSSLGEQIRNAADDFAIGSSYLNNGKGSVADALPWLQQGAAVPGYGLMSQLSLGDIYNKGTGGVGQNPMMASQYYEQALHSIRTLEASGTGEAQEILKSLPGGSAQQLKQELLTEIARLKRR